MNIIIVCKSEDSKKDVIKTFKKLLMLESKKADEANDYFIVGKTIYRFIIAKDKFYYDKSVWKCISDDVFKGQIKMKIFYLGG